MATDSRMHILEEKDVEMKRWADEEREMIIITLLLAISFPERDEQMSRKLPICALKQQSFPEDRCIETERSAMRCCIETERSTMRSMAQTFSLA